MDLAHSRFRNRQQGTQQRSVASGQGTTALNHLNTRALPRGGGPLARTEIALHTAGFDLAPLDFSVLRAVGELIGHTEFDRDITLFGDVDHRWFLQVILLRNVGDFKVSPLTWVIGDFSDVKAESEVTHGDVVNVFGSLVEGRSDF